MFDVIVVGAGPGGATAAYHLARAGLKTLLLEKEKMPRYKACGGGLTEKVPALLGDDFPTNVEMTITAASVAYGAERLSLDYRRPIAWCVMRDRFDQYLTERAARAGAEVQDARPVSRVEFDDQGARVTTRGETLSARVVVGADGVNGIVRRAAGFPPHARLGVALEAELQVPTPGLETWRQQLHIDFGAIHWGYAWIFPKAEHLSVGIGALMRPRRHLDLRAELVRYIRSEPSLTGARELLLRGHRIPLGGHYARYHGPGVVLVGDAAGVVDPFTAEGIYYAMRSGQIAGEEIAAAFALGRPDLGRYSQRINSEICSDLRYARALADVFYRMPRLSYRIFKRSRMTQATASTVVSGGSTYSGMLRQVLSHAFLSLLPR